LTLNLQALIDGPTTGVARHAHAFRRMTLTDFVIAGFPRGATSKIVRKYFEKEDILNKWNNSSWAKKLDDRKKRSVLTDFDRFKLLKLRKQVPDKIIKYFYFCFTSFMSYISFI
jgi:large subunit ribosomal protein L14e